MKLAIRDDDLSYWTSPKEIENLYGTYFDKGVKVSFAVVPNSFQLHHGGDRTKFYLDEERRPIYENHGLVQYIRDRIHNGNVEIMLHGYDHSYCIEQNGRNVFLSKNVREQVGNTNQLVFVPECMHKEDGLLERQLKEGKEILEDTFGVKVKMFVPPSNALRAGAVRIVEQLGMNISGTMLPGFNRDKDIYSFMVYTKKLLWRMRGKKISYPYVMNYKSHKELTGYALTPKTNMEKLNQQLQYCEEKKLYATIATHYWELLENDNLRTQLYRILDLALEKEYTMVGLSEIFD